MLNRLFPYSDKKVACLVISLLALVVYVITAVASYGFHHADELFQIIELAGIKSGTFTPCITWEYEAHIRPMLQPALCALFLKSLSLISVSDPFTLTLLIRLFSASISFLAIHLFVRNTANKFSTSNIRTVYLALSLLLWFIPYLSCRFSSETFGGVFFVYALALYFSEKQNISTRILFGICLALSFIFRFQMGLAILGFGLWALLIDKKDWRYFVVPAISFVVAYALLGIGIDSWFYGELVFAPYNYVMVNAEVSADMFGSEPWWFYLYNLVSYPTYFVGIPLAIAIIYLLARNPKNPYLWCFIPFFVVHSLIAHKEVRFLFPMAFLFPVMFMSMFDMLNRKLGENNIWKFSWQFILLAFASLNISGLGANMSKSAGDQTCYLAKHIMDNYNGQKVNIIHGLYSNPYGPYGGISGFYQNKNTTTCKFGNIYGIKLLLDPEAVNFFTCRKCDLEEMVCVGEFAGKNPFAVLRSMGFEYQSQSVPQHYEIISERYTNYDTGKILYVFKYVGDNYFPQKSDFKNVVFFYSDCEGLANSKLRTLTTENYHSANHSSMAYIDNPYGVKFEDSISKVSGARNLSVMAYIYQTSENKDACIAFEMLNSEDDKVWRSEKIIDKTDKTNQWVNIVGYFELPEDFKDYKMFKIYFFNPVESKSYCDDIFAVFY